MSIGPLSKGLEAAQHEYKAVKSIPLGASNLPTPKEGSPGIRAGPSDSSLGEMHFQAALDLGNAHCFLGNLKEAKTYLDEAETLAVEMGDVDKNTTATIHHGDWILGSGHLKEAIAKVFQPLLKRNMSDKNKGLMLQSFGNACRASADFGTAKEYLREAIAIAERLEDHVAVADRHGDLGTIFRSEGRFADALTHQKKQFVFANQRGDQAALVVPCFNIGFTHYSMSPPDYDMALVYHTVHLELLDRMEMLIT
ncbi:uncharacterized protein LOC117299561 [Asterias rubens]|uniref:uncharacterized protein LOC117299561 n=1 Tax=Asterias rubens TaxID=7604 RepID=UPI0014554E3F|nr:uncharacterized protein LOC117299561 [Asterias rubens]